MLSKEEQKKLKEEDSYGYKKLVAETFLIKQAEQYKFKYLSLRLADVIGPYDET